MLCVLANYAIAKPQCCTRGGAIDIGGVSVGCHYLINMATIGPIPSETGPTLEEILSQNGFKEEDLDRECPQDIR